MKAPFILAALLVGLAAVFAASSPTAEAATTCTFTTSGVMYKLKADCTTDSTITIPAGLMLDGQGKQITAVDPVGGHFLGAVVKNGGIANSVKNLRITIALSDTTCEYNAGALVGIMFDGAAGAITQTTITGARRPGCDEGDGIIVQNPPYNGTHPGTKTVNIGHNKVIDAKANGIIVKGDVKTEIYFNSVTTVLLPVSTSAAIFLGYGATGLVRDNTVSYATGMPGNVGILIQESNDISANRNKISGPNTGIFVVAYCYLAPTASNNTLTKNEISDVHNGIVIASMTFATISSCDPEANNNLARYNIVQGHAGAEYGIRVLTIDGNGVAAPDPVADANEVRNNTVSGFTTPFSNNGTNTVFVP